MQPALEDLYEDILGKAQRGLGKSDQEVIQESGILPEEWERAKAGVFDPNVARKVAPSLGISIAGLLKSGEKSWKPNIVAIEGVHQLHTAWEDMYVNAYLVWEPSSGKAVLFDTGADIEVLLSVLKEKKLDLTMILLTHSHPDHIAILSELRKVYPEIPVYLNPEENAVADTTPFLDGDRFQAGDLLIEARTTAGHSPGGTTYVVSGLQHPVAVVGDALFAGSMGGVPQGWKQSLRVNRKKILSLSGDTILCPGHGPMTTVQEELENNPFYGPGSQS